MVYFTSKQLLAWEQNDRFDTALAELFVVLFVLLVSHADMERCVAVEID